MSFQDLIERVVSPDKVRRGCDKCTLDRSQYVSDHIVPDCEIVIVGEAPGKNEVTQGKPFVGKAGQIARRALSEEGIDPNRCSWMNAVHCRPAGNKTPSDKIIQLCGKRNLLPGLSALDPKVVILVGASSFSLFFPRKELNKSRGNFRRQGKFTFLPTFHPAFVDHRGGIESKEGGKIYSAIRRDLSKVRRHIDGTLYSDRKYELVKTAEDARRWADFLVQQPLLSGDIEATALRSWSPEAQLLTIAFCWEPKHAVCFPVEHFEIEDERFKEVVRECVQRVLAAESVKTWHHAKFDVPWLRESGWTVNGVIICTMLIAYLLDESKKSYGLKQLTATELDGYSDIVEGNFAQQPLERLFYYNCEDADNGFQLFQVFKKRMDPGLWRVHDELLIPGSVALAEAERVGVRVDLDEVRRLQTELTVEMKTKIREANRQMSGGQTVTSLKDLRTHLFEREKLPVLSKTGTGIPQVDADVLKALRDDHGCELAGLVLEIRGLEKLTSTYLAPYPNLVEADGRIHCSFTFTRTVTGRLASEKPNLQNIPRDPRIRNLIVSRPGWKLLYGDLSTSEMRVAAALAREPTLMEIFRRPPPDDDVHTATASKVLKILEELVTKKQRQDAKPVNFGFLYGQKEQGFIGYAKSNYGLTFTFDEAHQIREDFFAVYAGLPSWYREVLEELYAEEQVRTVLGRCRRFPGLHQMNEMARGECERMAINTKVQSVSADLALLIVICAQSEFIERGMETRLILTVHDSVLCGGPPDEVPTAARIIHDRVEKFEEEFDWLTVPMRIDLGMGEKWASLEKMKAGVDF